MASTPALLVGARAVARPARGRLPVLLSRDAVLSGGDVVAMVGALTLLAVVVPTFGSQGRSPVLWIPLLVAVALGIAHVLDTYDRLFRAHLRHTLRRVAIAGTASLVACAGLSYLWWPVELERWPMARDALLLLGAVLVWRILGSVLVAHAVFRTRAVVLTHGRPSRGLRAWLRQGSWGGYELAGVVGYGRPGVAVAQQIEAVIRCLEREGAQLVIVDAPRHRESHIEAALLGLSERGVPAASLADVYELLSGRALLGQRWRPPRTLSKHRPDTYTQISRGLDLLVATLGLALAAPLLVLASAAIVLDSPGQPLYGQARVGRYGQRFRMLKLRTMQKDAETDRRAVWATRADPRVTRVGKLLRPCHIDEIPQLWNVLRGDMSLVGPRPERPEFVDLLTRRLPLYNARHAVRPGITGWAQVQFKYAASVRETTTKLQYDLFYIRHRNPVLDLVILLKTLLVVFRLEGV
jgi:exopolysaccharide biosynthesis polyprenyl glycosylphosphotransferase